jgi:hypothetical protein
MEAMTGAARCRTAIVIAAAALLLAAAAPSAALAGAVPWGEGCKPAVAGQPRTSATCGAQLIDGRAVPPPGAPPAVEAAIAAANHIAGRPYVWGGGHLGFESRGYDCSGAVGYALHGGGLLATTMVSGQLAYWGSQGPGRWIGVYANSHHVFMLIAGLRFDTRDAPPGVTGPRWHTYMVDSRNFAARHPPGL